jgi:hydrogenase nickel incorporation protein HypB
VKDNNSFYNEPLKIRKRNFKSGVKGMELKETVKVEMKKKETERIKAERTETRKIEIMESVYARNDEIAKETRVEMTKKGIFVVNVMGGPGIGKTTTLSRLIPLLSQPSFVIEGDIESDIDTQKLNALGIPTIQINTGGACHLDSPLIRDAASSLSLTPGYLFIENIGNLVCPAEFQIGEHIKMLISSVTEGSDKPYKYPLAFEKADVILINKWDLKEYVDFDEAYFEKGVRKLNEKTPIFKVSGKSGGGYEQVAQWLRDQAKTVIRCEA